MCVSLCELLPEDTDEPERLELLDAAIPARFTARLLPFDWGALPAACPRRCLHFTRVPVCFTFRRLHRWLFHASSGVSSPTTRRLSESAWARSPRLAVCAFGEALTLPHTLKVLPSRQIKIVRRSYKNTRSVDSVSPKHTSQTKICRSRFVPCRNQLWFPCATLRIVINTLHCSVDAPS